MLEAPALHPAIWEHPLTRKRGTPLFKHSSPPLPTQKIAAGKKGPLIVLRLRYNESKALAAFASRLSPSAPKELSDFIKQARKKKTRTPKKNELQSTSPTHGENETTDQRTQDRSLRREREISPLDHSGGGSQDERGLRRRVHVSEAYGLITQAVPGAAEDEILKTAQITAAQLNATFEGSKPAFLETIPGYASSLANELPPGVRFTEAGGLECIYNEAAVAKELNLPAGADVDAVVREKLKHGNYGGLLGYGMDTVLERPCIRVEITRNGKKVFGFRTSTDMQEATQYAQQRRQTPHLRDQPGQHPDL